MSALSTPGGGGTTAQSKPTSGKQKYQKLDINSLYCANKNENSEPSSVKSQLSRKHGMQSLGKVPSTRRPPANLPSLKTETGQDPNANSVSTTSTTVSSPPTCISQTLSTTASSVAGAGAGSGGWVPLPPPSSPHFRTEFPSLEAAAQPSHRPDHSAPQPQLRPQTEGSWTSGGTAGVRPEAASSPAPAAIHNQPVYRAIMPPFLVKGNVGGGLGLGGLSALRERGPAPAGGGGGARIPPRPPPTPRAVEVLTARPILRDEQISSLDDISRDAGWAQHDDIDYDQKLDFSDGESSAPNRGSNKNNRGSIENDRADKLHESGDEDQLWAERRQKQTNEVAQAVARAKQRKEEEHRRQMRDAVSQPSKDFRDIGDRDRNDNRERELDSREKDRIESRDRTDRDRDRMDRQDVREKERNDMRDRDNREKERLDNRDRDRVENRERFDNRDRDRERDVRDRERDRNKLESRDRTRHENRDRQDRSESDKERIDSRDRDRNENRDRIDRDRFERERDRERDRDRDRERADRERTDRDRDRERDRDFRDRDYARERDQNNPAFSKSFQANIPPRFLKQQQNRQQDEPQHKGWAFTGKPRETPRRQEPPSYNAQRHPPHNGRRSYSRDYSDREDDFRRDKDGSGPQWRSEMQDYERSGREFDRSNSKDSYKDFNDYKGKNESDRKSLESSIDQNSRSAADKLSEVFERKSIGIIEPFSSADSSQNVPSERRVTPPSVVSRRESVEKDFLKTASWAEVSQEETNDALKSATDKISTRDAKALPDSDETKRNFQPSDATAQNIPVSNNTVILPVSQNQNKYPTNTPNVQPLGNNQQPSQTVFVPNVQSSSQQSSEMHKSILENKQNVTKPAAQTVNSQTESATSSQIQKSSSDHLPQTFAKIMYPPQKSEKESSEVDSQTPKSNIDLSNAVKKIDASSAEVTLTNNEPVKRIEDKRSDMHGNIDQGNKFPGKEPVERKSSGSGSEKKARGFGSGGYAVVYNRGWGSRESRGRRSHRSSRSNNRASESDGSTDGTPNMERKERRRAPRSPRGPKKSERLDDNNRPPLPEQSPMVNDGMENREPFAPRGQPSRRGRGGFHGASRPPAPAKRVTGYGPPNTKSPFSQANRAVKENEEAKDIPQTEDKGRVHNKLRTGSSTGRGRDRRPKGPGGPHSGEDENWETTSEHSEGGANGGRRRSVPGRQQGQLQKGQGGGRNQNPKSLNNRNMSQGTKKDGSNDKTADISEAMTDLKLAAAKKDEEVVDDGFQEVRNKKNSKEARGSSKEDNQQGTKQQSRSHSNQGGGRNGSSSRNPNEKLNPRGAPQVPGKNTQYDRPRQANLAPRFVKQRQKQQMGLVSSYGPDTGAAPPPPAVNAWDKPLRGNVEEPAEVVETKSNPSSQRGTPAEALNDIKSVPTPIAVPGDKSGVLDGATPPVETIIFENTNYKSAPSEEALQQKYQMNSNVNKPPTEEMPAEIESRTMPFNGDVRARPRSIQELIGDNGRPVTDGEAPSLGLQMGFDTAQKAEDSSDMKLDFAFDSDLGITEDKSAKTLLPRGVHMSTSNTISPLAADLNLKIASVKKVWEMPAVAEGTESDLQFAGFEETNTETGAPPNVCKVKPTQQLQSPPPQLYNHVGYQGGYGGLSVPSPPAMLFNSSQQLVGSSQQLPQQGSLYGAFLDQSRGQFGGFPGTPYAAGSAAPYNYQPPPDMFQSLPNQYRMAATAGGGAAFGQSGQLGNNPSTVLISSTSNSLMSATVKPSSQQIGAIGSKGGGVGGVGGVSAYQQQYLGYGAGVGVGVGVGEAPYSLVPRGGPPASSYYSPYQPAAAPAPTYPLQFTQPAQSAPFNSQFLSTLQAAAVQQMQQQYRAPMQQQYAPPPRPPPQQQLKSPLHEHANGFAPLCESGSPTPKGASKPQKAPHSPPHHKYHAPPPPPHTPHQHHQHQMVSGGARGPPPSAPPRYPAPIQRPHAPALPVYRAPTHPPPQRHHAQRPHLYYHHHQRNDGGGGGGGGGERAPDGGGGGEAPGAADEAGDAPPQPDQPAADLKPE